MRVVRHVAQDDGALFPGLVGQFVQNVKKGLAGLGQVACLELGVAFEGGQTDR
ncbi:hypothetical protein ACFYY8_12850 [Streptosporangium sp. NPDC001559]|uniref:hypothetical protein n=1 Tax=Streptosporangium sp. NPDC001559 TaxID=3366187 RepID=UPI0036EDCB6B